VVTDPSSGKEIARGRTDAAGNVVIRQLNAPVRPGTTLQVRCGETTIPVEVGG
jgi:hypothetical protein